MSTTIKYKGNAIATMTTTGSKTLKTSGKYCEADIVVENTAESGKNVQAYQGMGSVRTTSYTATGVKLTVAKSGTYKVSWIGIRNTNSGTNGTQLYIAGKSYGSASTTFTNTYAQSVVLNNVSLTAGQTIEVYGRARSTSYYMMVGNLVIEEQ